MSENTTTDNSALLTPDDAMRHADLVTYFEWDTEAQEGRLDACNVWINSTTISETLPPVNGAPAYRVHVEGTAKSHHGYDYRIYDDVVVKLQENSDGELVPMVDDEEEGGQGDE